MLRCITIDDEPLALQLISSYVREIPFLELVKSCTTLAGAAEVLSAGKIDLIFLDIVMPGQNGIQFMKSFKQPPAVIFTTGHSKYAIEAFELNAMGYLMKPISFDHFLHVTERAYRILYSRSKLGLRNPSIDGY